MCRFLAPSVYLYIYIYIHIYIYEFIHAGGAKKCIHILKIYSVGNGGGDESLWKRFIGCK